MQDLVFVEHLLHPVDAIFPLHMLFTVERGSVTGLAKQSRKTRFNVFFTHWIARIAMVPVRCGRQSREEICPAGHADRCLHKGILKANSLTRQFVDHRCSDLRMSSTTERCVALVIDEHKHNVWFRVGGSDRPGRL